MAKTKEQLAAQGHTGPIYEIGEDVPPSKRFRGRTKGLPYSRMSLAGMQMRDGEPAILRLQHPTRGTTHVKHATPELLRVFFPSLPDALYGPMLGIS